MKTKIALFTLIVVGTVLFSMTKDGVHESEKTISSVNQEVKIATSALKKSAARVLKEQTEIKQDDSQKDENIKKLLALQSFDQMNETMATTLNTSLAKVNLNSSILSDYINKFDFNKEMGREYRRLHKDDLYSLVEILDHPTSQKLKSYEQQSQQDLAEYMQQGVLPSISNDKKFIINEILDELNAMEQTERMVSGLLQGTFSTAILESNPKATSAEAQAQAQEFASQMAKQQLPLLKTAFEIAYDKVDTPELEEYLHFMQKTDARRASEINRQVTEKVMNKFLKGFITRLIQVKKSKVPNPSSI